MMGEAPKLVRLERRMRRSKRMGKIVLGGVLLASVAFGGVLLQGLLMAVEAGRDGLVVRAWIGLGLLLGLDVFSAVLIRRQHRILDEARVELQELITGDGPH